MSKHSGLAYLRVRGHLLSAEQPYVFAACDAESKAHERWVEAGCPTDLVPEADLRAVERERDDLLKTRAAVCPECGEAAFDGYCQKCSQHRVICATAEAAEILAEHATGNVAAWDGASRENERLGQMVTAYAENASIREVELATLRHQLDAALSRERLRESRGLRSALARLVGR